MNPFKKLPVADRVLLTVVWVAVSLSTVAWTLRDRTPPPWDPADHLTAAYDYAQPLAHGNLAGFAREFFVEHHYYAPLVHLATGFFYLVLGPSRLSGIAVNLLAAAVLLYSVYWIGDRLYGPSLPAESEKHPKGDAPEARETRRFSVSAGALAALLATSYHFPAWLLHDAFLDYPLTAIVAAALALLINAGDFATTRKAIWFGIVMGLGLLTKQTFVFFLALPLLYCAIRVLLLKNLRAIFNLALSGLIATGIAAVWYWPHVNDVIDIYRVNQQGALDENEAPLFSFMSNVFYLHGLVSSQIQLFFGLLLVFGLAYSIVRLRRQTVLLYLWLAGGIAAFTLIANKDMRYTVPVLPAAALISVCWASSAPKPVDGWLRRLPASLLSRIKEGIVLLVLGWCTASFLNAQWPRRGSGTYIDTPRFRWMVFARNYFGFDHAPLAEDWSVPEIVKTTAALGLPAPRVHPGAVAGLIPIDDAPRDRVPSAGTDLTKPTLGVIVNLPYLNPSSISLYARLMSPNREGLPLINVDWIVNDSGRPQLATCDYILVRTGLADAEWVSPMERFMEQEIRSHPDSFVRVASFPIPLPGAEAVIYRCDR